MSCDLYRHYDAKGTLLYVGESLCAVSRLAQHRRDAHWFNQIASVSIEKHVSKDAARSAELEAIVNERPLHNKRGVPIANARHNKAPGSRWRRYTHTTLEFDGVGCDDGLDDGFSHVMETDNDRWCWANMAAAAMSEKSGLIFQNLSHNNICRLIHREVTGYFGRMTKRDIAEFGWLKMQLESFEDKNNESQYPAWLAAEEEGVLIVLYNCAPFDREAFKEFQSIAYDVFWTLDQFRWTTYFGFYAPPRKFNLLPIYA